MSYTFPSSLIASKPPAQLSRDKKDENLSPEISKGGSGRRKFFSRRSRSPAPQAETSSSSFVSKDTESLSKQSFEVEETPVNPSTEPASSLPRAEVFDRPKTPPQGSNHSPWTSYHDLPANHPVFAYPAEKREKLYAQGIDPVYKAWYDASRFGVVYGDPPAKKARRHMKQFLGSLGGGGNTDSVAAGGHNSATGIGPI